MSLFLSIRSELLKAKRTATLYLCILAAAFIPAIFFLEFCVGTLEPDTLKNPWGAFFLGGAQGLSFFILPAYVILSCTLLPQIEYRYNTWKQAMVAPQPKAQLFLSKFLVMHLFILLLLVLFTGLMLITAGLAQLLRPEVLLFSSASDWPKYINTIGYAYVTILGISAVQFWLSMRLKNFIAPIGIGFALWLTTGILMFEMKWQHADKLPFSYPILHVYPATELSTTILGWSSFGYAILFVVLGFMDFRKKIVKA
jgi:hypothetical protein